MEAAQVNLETLQKDINNNPSACGLAIVISNDYKSIHEQPNLEGTIKDGDAMADTFKKLGYAVVRKHNATFSYLIALLKKVGSDIIYPTTYKRVAFVFAGHGEDSRNLITSEGKKILIDTIIYMLSPSEKNANSCPLGSMARLFFIDACRGKRDDLGILVTPRGGSPHSHAVSRGGNAVERLRIPSEPNNICVAYSTVSGFRSYEIEGLGGIWMQRLAKKLLEVDDTVQNVLTEVNTELKDLWQKQGYKYIMNPECHLRLSERVNLFREKEAIKTPPSTCKPKFQLAASFSKSPPKPPVPPPPCRTASIPPVAQTRVSEIVVGRQAIVSNPGQYRAKLNEYKMNKWIKEVQFMEPKCKQDVEVPNQLTRRCIVKCVLPGGKEIFGDSVHYYPGKKIVSEEKAAEDALKKVDQFYEREQSLKPSVAKQPVAPTSPKEKVYKQKLNNFLFQQQKSGMPEYTCMRDDRGCFQCSVSHPSFGTVSGSSFSTKKEAENSAAWRAWTTIHTKCNLD